MKVTLRTTLDRDLAKRAREIAEKREISFSAILERALDRYLPLIDDNSSEKGRRPEELRRAA
ncbi:ribbon-helix-helix protein, CopG family [Candidatus Acetothermia bacterium]|jgi:predicted transcriptional regulator|nr:ribbon-helix-helix protein, CopG family [Candidatus Acetothermia bacterium]MCI2432224.1 ribbon-helix-helix protein, CopG family [Candidatus Acetothermia bacterium]MCI2436127.1 ribbon-helix-helix protein, CopG family [Candidatus Acetothermia bacterium]